MDSDWGIIDELSGRHKDTIVVVGTSGSLNELDMGALSTLTRIGTNDALGKFDVMNLPVPEYLLTAELIPVQRAFPDLITHSEVTLITRERVAGWACSNGFAGPVFIYELTTKQPRPMVRGPLLQANNTAHYAVQVAARVLGFEKPSQILLAGVDLRYPTQEEQDRGKTDHYWGEGKIDGCKPNFGTALRMFPDLVNWLSVRGIKLATLSPWNGPLTDMMPRVKLEEIV